MTTEEMEAYLAALQAAKYSGVRRVKHGDTETEFASMNDLNKAINDLLAQLAGASTGTRVQYIKQSSRG